MVQQAQPEALLRALSSQLGVSPAELQERARQSRLGQAAQVAALQDGCGCRACRLLRQTLDTLVEDAMKELAPPAKPVRAELVGSPPAAPPEG